MPTNVSATKSSPASSVVHPALHPIETFRVEPTIPVWKANQPITNVDRNADTMRNPLVPNVSAAVRAKFFPDRPAR